MMGIPILHDRLKTHGQQVCFYIANRSFVGDFELRG
jgi:hypothetical protein